MGRIHYNLNTILTLDILNNNNPQFISVKDIDQFHYKPDKIIFEWNLLTTISFDEHVNCYEITIP